MFLPGKASSPADLLHERWLETDTARPCRCRSTCPVPRAWAWYAGPWPQQDNRSFTSCRRAGRAGSPAVSLARPRRPPRPPLARALAAQLAVAFRSGRIVACAQRCGQDVRLDPGGPGVPMCPDVPCIRLIICTVPNPRIFFLDRSLHCTRKQRV